MNTEFVRFRLSPELLELLDEHAKRNRRSRANQLRVIIEDWLMDRADTPARQTANECAAAVPAGTQEAS